MTVAEHDEASSGLSLFLQRGDDEVALWREDFLRGLEEFKALSSRDQWGMLENDILWVNSNRILSSGDYEIHLRLFCLQNTVFTIDFLGRQQAALKKRRGLTLTCRDGLTTCLLRRGRQMRKSPVFGLTWIVSWSNEADKVNCLRCDRAVLGLGGVGGLRASSCYQRDGSCKPTCRRCQG